MASTTPTVSAERRAILDRLTVAAWTGAWTELVTEDCVFVAHHGVEMPVGAFFGWSTGVGQAGAFPDWKWTNKTIEQLPDGRVRIGSRQHTGKLQADIPAIGPFPAVSFADVPDRLKNEAVVLPVEIGFITFNSDNKIVKLDWGTGELGDTSESNVMDLWNAGIVGPALLYHLAGTPLPSPSSFFIVRHSFKLGKAEHWWATLGALQAEEGKMEAWSKACADMGFANHWMISTGSETHSFCLWEAAAGKTGAEFQEFIDGPAGPSFGCISNECFPVRVDLAGNPPAKPVFHAVPEAAAAPAVNPGSVLYLIHHSFLPGKAQEWWGSFAELASEPEKMAAWTAEVEKAGFFNHCFMPTGQATDAFCLWEAQPGTTAAQMQAFIDGPLGPSFGCFTNRVMLIDEARSNVAAVERKFQEHTVIARFSPAEGKAEELLKVFTDALPGTVSGPHGNNLIEAYVDPATQDVVLYEKWATKADFEKYFAFRTADGTVPKIISLAAKPPHIMHLHRELDGEVRNNVPNGGHTVCAKFVAKEGVRAELMQIFADAYPVTHEYEGNLHLSMYTDPEDANAFYLWEQWTTPKAFEQYFQFRVDEGFIGKIKPMLGAPPAPAPLEVRWQNKEASTVKTSLDKAKATDAALRLASPSHAGAVPPASPKKLRTTTA